MTSKRVKHLKDLMVRARANAFEDLTSMLVYEVRGVAGNSPYRVEMIVAAHSRMERIDAALLRIERGTYGQCLDCGNALEEDRLLAQPWLETCLSCERRNRTERLDHLPIEFKSLVGRPVEAAWQA